MQENTTFLSCRKSQVCEYCLQNALCLWELACDLFPAHDFKILGCSYVCYDQHLLLIYLFYDPPHSALILFTKEQELGIWEVTEQQLQMERTFTGEFMLCCFRQQFNINCLSCPQIAELSACFSGLFLS